MKHHELQQLNEARSEARSLKARNLALSILNERLATENECLRTQLGWAVRSLPSPRSVFGPPIFVTRPRFYVDALGVVVEG